MTKAAVDPPIRTDESIVVVHQCPWGAASTRRAPPATRPYSRVRFVLAPLSSRKTSRSGSTSATC